MTDYREVLARQVRDELGEFNDPNEPVVLLVRRLVKKARLAAIAQGVGEGEPGTLSGEEKEAFDALVREHGREWTLATFTALRKEMAAKVREADAYIAALTPQQDTGGEG